MTNEELIQAFPECEKIKREQIAECVTKAMTEEKFYREAADKIYRKAHELYPIPGGRYNKDYPGHAEYWLYFSGDYPKTSPFKQWLEKFETEFIALHGQVRTFDEACQTAADEWARMIFGNHIQNNGDESDAGGYTMVLGTLIKDKAKGGYGKDVIDKFRSLMADHYRGGCRWTSESGTEYRDEPYVDYHPSPSLRGLLVKAGCKEKDAEHMCPWKTGITIDKCDNSVCVHGYRTARYL